MGGRNVKMGEGGGRGRKENKNGDGMKKRGDIWRERKKSGTVAVGKNLNERERER